jgi:dsDNA-specific endonuclease/ATPase MutS2
LELEQHYLKIDRDFWKRIAERNQTQTLRQKLDQSQAQLKEQTERAEKVEQELETLRNALERERQISQKELAQCQQVLNEQAAIIAEQHQKLARLLGTDTASDRA